MSRRAPLLLAAAILVASAAPAAARAAGPRVSAFLAGGGSAWRADACGCVDRAVWGGGGGAGLEVRPGLWLEAEAEAGVVAVAGVYPTGRFGGGVRLRLAELGVLRPWVRAGGHAVLVSGARDGAAASLWVQPGLALAVTPRLLLDLGVTVERVFGAMSRVEVGFRQGVRFTF